LKNPRRSSMFVLCSNRNLRLTQARNQDMFCNNVVPERPMPWMLMGPATLA